MKPEIQEKLPKGTVKCEDFSKFNHMVVRLIRERPRLRKMKVSATMKKHTTLKKTLVNAILFNDEAYRVAYDDSVDSSGKQNVDGYYAPDGVFISHNGRYDD